MILPEHNQRFSVVNIVTSCGLFKIHDAIVWRTADDNMVDFAQFGHNLPSFATHVNYIQSCVIGEDSLLVSIKE